LFFSFPFFKHRLFAIARKNVPASFFTAKASIVSVEDLRPTCGVGFEKARFWADFLIEPKDKLLQTSHGTLHSTTGSIECVFSI
jgi:hypothetical protein